MYAAHGAIPRGLCGDGVDSNEECVPWVPLALTQSLVFAATILPTGVDPSTLEAMNPELASRPYYLQPGELVRIP